MSSEPEQTSKDSEEELIDDYKKKVEIIRRFAEQLGTASGKPSIETNRFSSSLSEDAVLCNVPSLKILPEDLVALPQVGTTTVPKVGVARAMPKVVQSNTNASASITNTSTATANKTPNPVQETVEQKVAKRLGTRIPFTKSTILTAPIDVATNISGSFSGLVESRVKAWTLLMLKQSIASGDRESRARLLAMLSAPTKVTSTVTSFKALPLPMSAREEKSADLVLPLLFEARCGITLRNQEEQVIIRAPGTISGIFKDNDNEVTDESYDDLRRMDVHLDAKKLFTSMFDQARLAVFKTVPNVASGAPTAKVKTTPSIGLSKFGSSLGLASIQQGNGQGLHKATSSSIRFNSILQGKGNLNGGASVSRNTSNRLASPLSMSNFSRPPPVTNMNANRLKSIKSFGRAHAGDFGSGGPQNATFATFGASTPTWGRDGRMINKPSPTERFSVDEDVDVSKKNANFSFSKNTMVGSRGGLSSMANSSRGATMAGSSSIGNLGNLGLPTSNMTKSPSVLENWYMEKTKGRNIL